jgi:hypothetical protein
MLSTNDLDSIISKHKINFPNVYRENCINDVLEYFKLDNWCKHVPQYQTWPVLFERKEPHWQYLRNSFLNAANLDSFQKINAWAYVSFVDKPSNEQELYHTHNLKYSAVFYLSISSSKKGTVFLIDDFLISPVVDDSSWYLFNSNIFHSPSHWDYVNEKQNRIVLAVEYE